MFRLGVFLFSVVSKILINSRPFVAHTVRSVKMTEELNYY